MNLNLVLIMVLASAAMVQGGVMILSLRYHHVPAAPAFQTLLGLGALWALASALELNSTSLQERIFWHELRYVIVDLIMIALLVMAVRYTGRDAWITPARLALLLVVPLISAVLVLGEHSSSFFHSNFILDTSGPLPALHALNGPWHWIRLVYVYLVGGLAVVMLLRWLVRQPWRYSRQTILIVIGASLPMLADLLYDLGLSPVPGYNLASASTLFTGLLVGWGVFRYHNFEILPVAHQVVLDSIPDLVLVLDGQRRLVDLNPAARQALGLRTHQDIGQAAVSLLADYPALLEALRPGQPSTSSEVLLLQAGQPHFYEATVSPIYTRGQGTGRLVLMREITRRKLAEDELRANLAQIEALRARLSEQSVRDPLTGLFNRRYLSETLEREIARAGRGAYSLCVFMIDLDHFKEINDGFGHEAGDIFLQALGEDLRRTSRAGDIACRVGGDEFVLVLPQAGLEDGLRRAGEWRAEVEQLGVPYHTACLKVTLSMGVAVYPQHGQTVDDLLRAADQAMYRAKGAGRNRVEPYSL